MGTTLTFEQRLLSIWSKVNREGPVPPLHPQMTQCWIWTGAIDDKGYGTFMFPDPKYPSGQICRKAHRVVYLLVMGYWPSLELDHLCHVTACVRPDHMREATRKENANNLSRRICVRGHELTEENFYYYGAKRRRRCRLCLPLARAEWLAKRKKA